MFIKVNLDCLKKQRNWLRFSLQQPCRPNIYVIAIVQISIEFIQNGSGELKDYCCYNCLSPWELVFLVKIKFALFGKLYAKVSKENHEKIRIYHIVILS